ncbi:hypothetical protein TWF569_009449 [Orbilia oligospora]|uniref:Uncharacterized protein n=1 Tax=Orbilia oligospora TaxID=2813651 RepID=A0A7C8NGZ8_ORBOL|nr:hypothetical protein TWF103_002271 [Orbilia oligospora]KAF3109127.1 hypothetical protein TWF102_009904 [Orbilia oligospora]KAF3136457.1 hypothetical protein TWF569_009449 [Orbilia oligospora]KAF3152949.1 hypothetical protein TWF594_000005 [Orbilia oligospora]
MKLSTQRHTYFQMSPVRPGEIGTADSRRRTTAGDKRNVHFVGRAILLERHGNFLIQPGVKPMLPHIHWPHQSTRESRSNLGNHTTIGMTLKLPKHKTSMHIVPGERP